MACITGKACIVGKACDEAVGGCGMAAIMVSTSTGISAAINK